MTLSRMVLECTAVTARLEPTNLVDNDDVTYQ